MTINVCFSAGAQQSSFGEPQPNIIFQGRLQNYLTPSQLTHAPPRIIDSVLKETTCGVWWPSTPRCSSYDMIWNELAGDISYPAGSTV